jgi:hypothetical protein
LLIVWRDKIEFLSTGSIEDGGRSHKDIIIIFIAYNSRAIVYITFSIPKLLIIFSERLISGAGTS